MKNPGTVFQLLFSAIFTLCTICLQGQSWQHGYLGTDAVEGQVIPTSDGGFLSGSWGDYIAFKTDANGTQQWTLNGPDSLDSYFVTSVAALPDGNYVVVGRGNNTTPPGTQKTFAIKVDLAGNEIWEKYYASGSGGFYSVAVAADGGLYIGGQYNFLMKTNAAGNSLWINPGVSAQSLVASADGGVIVLVNDNVTGSNSMFLQKYNDNLGLVWSQVYSTPGGSDLVGKSISATSDGGVVITGMEYYWGAGSGNFSDLFLKKVDAIGNEVWYQLYAETNSQIGLDTWQTQDGGYLVTGWKTWGSDRYVWLWRFDGQGNVLWDRGYFSGEGLSVQELADGSIIMLTRGLRLVHTDAQGTVFQNFIKGNITDDQNFDCNFQPGEPGLQDWAVWANGPFSTVAFSDANGDFEIPVDTGSYTLVPTPPTLVWQLCQATQNVALSNSPQIFDLGVLPAQSVAFTTTTISGIVYQDLDGDCEQDPGEPGIPGCTVWAAEEWNYNNPQFFATSDANGFYSFTLPAALNYYYVMLEASPNNPFCQPCNNDYFNYLGVVPLTHNIGVQCQTPAPHHLTGFVFFDENENCQPDFGEPGMNAWTLDVVKMGTTDTFQIESTVFPNGNFAVAVDTGNYYLTVFPPNYLYLPCQFIYTVTVGLGGAPPVYIPLMPLADCPKMRVDVGASFIRPCFPATYVVNYCNDGTVAAEDAYVEVSFPPAFTVDSSQIPGLPLSGNVWQFQLGDIPKDSCGTFLIFAFLDCADSVGLTYCVEAHIFPDSLCGPANPQWDGSSVELSAACVGDSVVLTIVNSGWGDMSQPLEFVVVEDNVLIRDSSFQLPAGGSTSVTVYPNGATIVMSAEQSANHPGMSMPLVFVEGCGDDSISLGFVTPYQQDDADCFLAIDCRESVAACDPNTKEAQPKGITDAHFIEPTTDLTYQITFQNLGSAPAQNVVILDTLSPFLDTGRIELGAASHPFTYELLPPNILKFSFENIQLPHADQNYDASIGFVKFRVKQTPANQPGALLENRAGIYFDFNAPVITNTVTHRIPSPQMIAYQELSVCAGEGFPTDTTLSDTLRYAFFDSIFVTFVDVLPTLISLVDTTVQAGSLVYGVLVFSDTIFTQTTQNDDDCFARTVVAHVQTSTAVQLVNLQFLGVAPNPSNDGFVLHGKLETGASCQVKLLDGLGREVLSLLKNQWLEGRFDLRMEVEGLAPGMYQLVFQAGEVKRNIKVVVF